MGRRLALLQSPAPLRPSSLDLGIQEAPHLPFVQGPSSLLVPICASLPTLHPAPSASLSCQLNLSTIVRSLDRGLWLPWAPGRPFVATMAPSGLSIRAPALSFRPPSRRLPSAKTDPHRPVGEWNLAVLAGLQEACSVRSCTPREVRLISRCPFGAWSKIPAQQDPSATHPPS